MPSPATAGRRILSQSRPARDPRFAPEQNPRPTSVDAIRHLADLGYTAQPAFLGTDRRCHLSGCSTSDSGRSRSRHQTAQFDPQRPLAALDPEGRSCPRPRENHSAGHLRARLIQTGCHSRIKDSPRPRFRFYCCVRAKARSVFTQPGPLRDLAGGMGNRLSRVVLGHSRVCLAFSAHDLKAVICCPEPGARHRRPSRRSLHSTMSVFAQFAST
jgi:hypothetical protein